MPQKIPSLISKELCIIKFLKLCIIRADRAVHFINFFCKQNKRKFNYKNIKEKKTINPLSFYLLFWYLSKNIFKPL